MFQSVLKHESGKFLKLGLAMAAIAAAVFVLAEQTGNARFSFWLDYVFGLGAGGLALWLAWYGVRRRRYATGGGKLTGWLSAHVYIGLAAVIVTAFHAGPEFGANVHTLAFVLFLFTSASGALGLILILVIPPRIARTADGRTLDAMVQQIAEINRESRALASPLDDDANRLVRRSVQYTPVTVGFWRRLMGWYNDSFMEEAAVGMRRYAEGGGKNADIARQIVVLLARKSDLLAAARRHVQLQTVLQAWRVLHIPATLAFLAALFVHVFVVHYYW